MHGMHGRVGVVTVQCFSTSKNKYFLLEVLPAVTVNTLKDAKRALALTPNLENFIKKPFN